MKIWCIILTLGLLWCGYSIHCLCDAIKVLIPKKTEWKITMKHFECRAATSKFLETLMPEQFVDLKSLDNNCFLVIYKTRNI